MDLAFVRLLAISIRAGAPGVAGALAVALSLSLACGPLKVSRPQEDAGTGTEGDVPHALGPSFGVGETDATPAAPSTGVAPRPPGSEQCAEEAIQGELVPLDLMMVLDASGSMNLKTGNRTRWQLVSEALGSFMRDPRSVGLGVGFQTFPYTLHEKSCTSDAECGGAAGSVGRECARPFLCIGPGVLPATAATCDPNDAFCPAGTQCVRSGRCTSSSMRCTNLGEPCPGGGNSDVCGEAPLICKIPIDSCEPADYERPKVPIGVLPGALAAVTRGLNAVNPASNTPIAAAVEGAARYLRQHAAMHPDRRAALVLASDASPTACQNSNIEGVAAALNAARAGTPALPTYIIGVVSAGDAIRSQAATQLAQAGGTSTPILLNDSATDLGTRFLDALNTIRGSALPCEFRIPRPTSGTLDYNKVNVRFTGISGPADLLYVGSADRCDPARGGWHYDVDPAAGAPATVRVCDATCRQFKAEATGVVELRFGCRTRID
jgi:hypothetical protein